MDAMNERLREEIARHMRAMRKKAKLTQVELAEKTGILQPSISEMERGNRLPQLDTLATIARALGITLNEMLPHFDPAEDEDS